MIYNVTIIGAGKLGKTLGYLLQRTDDIVLQGVCNQQLASSQAAVRFMGGGRAVACVAELPPADIVFITCPDVKIAQVCDELCTTKRLKPGNIILHCSGCLSSDQLASAKAQQCYTASVHPMHSFADPSHSVQHFAGTYCAIEGDPEALAILDSVFTRIGAQTYRIDPTHKTHYHIAGVVASNYLVSLHHLSAQLLQQAAVPSTLRPVIIQQLMQDTLNNLAHSQDAKAALTGPLQRGDVKTIEQHLQALDQPQWREVYQRLGSLTLALTDLPPTSKAHLKGLLEEGVLSKPLPDAP